MKIAWVITIIVTIAVLGLVTYFDVNGNENEVKPEGYCAIDSDCIPDSCCHAAGCVAKEKAPLCKGILCTQECVIGTLDCGQGSCKCINNKCQSEYIE